MKIKMSKIDSVIRLLEKIPYHPINEKSKIFFEIDCGKLVDDGNFIIEVKDTDKGAASLVKPGLALSLVKGEKKDKTVVRLAYAQTDYAPKFNIISYLEILNIKLSSKDKVTLSELDACLVRSDYILSEFEI